MDWIGCVQLPLVRLVSLECNRKCARLKGRFPYRISTKVQVESFAAEGRMRGPFTEGVFCSKTINVPLPVRPLTC